MYVHEQMCVTFLFCKTSKPNSSLFIRQGEKKTKLTDRLHSSQPPNQTTPATTHTHTHTHTHTSDQFFSGNVTAKKVCAEGHKKTGDC